MNKWGYNHHFGILKDDRLKSIQKNGTQYADGKHVYIDQPWTFNKYAVLGSR